MFRVHHIFPSTGEWGSVEVDTLEEALTWYDCKIKARNVISSIVTLYEDNNILKQTMLGSSSVVE
jgi:hypothetical protein